MPPAYKARPMWLLLLPCPTERFTLDTIRSEYASVLSQVLKRAADISASLSTVAILDIALSCPEVLSSEVFHYGALQSLLCCFYRLICSLLEQHAIDISYGNDVDVRFQLCTGSIAKQAEVVSSGGPIVTFQKLATCGRPWQRICCLESEDGEVLLQSFIRLRSLIVGGFRDEVAVESIPAGSPSSDTSRFSPPVTSPEAPRARHNAVAVGGTFDHLHMGHKLLLSLTALVLNVADTPDDEKKRSITVGITGDKLLEKKKFREQLQDWNERQALVQSFLRAFLVINEPEASFSRDSAEGSQQQRTIIHSFSSHLTINYVEIFDAFGPTITDESISALVLSGETRSGGQAVNEKREEKGWSALDVFEVDVLDASTKEGDSSSQATEGFENKLSSTEIRRRLAERSGTKD
ncbi:MAG: hypothetical protein Q9220_001513 [cf. Caloplaca sp. 1 TL-2023]